MVRRLLLFLLVLTPTAHAEHPAARCRIDGLRAGLIELEDRRLRLESVKGFHRAQHATAQTALANSTRDATYYSSAAATASLGYAAALAAPAVALVAAETAAFAAAFNVGLRTMAAVGASYLGAAAARSNGMAAAEREGRSLKARSPLETMLENMHPSEEINLTEKEVLQWIRNDLAQFRETKMKVSVMADARLEEIEKSVAWYKFGWDAPRYLAVQVAQYEILGQIDEAEQQAIEMDTLVLKTACIQATQAAAEGNSPAMSDRKEPARTDAAAPVRNAPATQQRGSSAPQAH